MQYFAPRSRDEALQILASERVRIVAGGTDVYPALRDRPATDSYLDISRVPEFRGISTTADGWHFGAATTWTDVASANLPACFHGLQAAAREVGSVQIQNTGTIAGNICNASPAADGIPPLLSLEADVEVCSLDGTRTVPLNAFVTGVRRVELRPGEMVTAIRIRKQAGRSAFLKLGARRYLVISIAMVAVIVEADADGRVVRARIAVGACSPVACRLPELEAALIGLPALPEVLASAMSGRHLAPLSPIDDVRADAAYRIDAAGELIRRALCAATAETREIAA
ncbi:FAD binding domain-containing protein [Rhizobium sp. TRM95111]|uniref:FAD binding domain-containing protein n=1 Tax=Rhizobium alarense TaxID=2846851 RepID=UPI001F24F1E9|nr:FAD binding domain-containing protein [Rhizobium alarense]MCF3642676.1 FAD binding domain-containing protein [Rhizobium alarense]